MIFGLILALGSAAGHQPRLPVQAPRRGGSHPPVSVRHPLRSAAGLLRSKWFLVGWIVAVLAWGLHVGALSLAPLSIVQAVFAGGLVFLAVFAERFFGFHLGRRQWIGVTITAAGLAVIGVTGGGANDPEHASLAALIAVEGGLFVIVAALIGSRPVATCSPGARDCFSARPPVRCGVCPTSPSSTSPTRSPGRCSGC